MNAIVQQLPGGGGSGDAWDFTSSAVAYTGAGEYSAAHGLGAVPSNFAVFAKCLTAEGDFAVDDWVKIGTVNDNNVADHQQFADDTNVYLHVNVSIRIGAAGSFATTSDWELYFVAKA